PESRRSQASRARCDLIIRFTVCGDHHRAHDKDKFHAVHDANRIEMKPALCIAPFWGRVRFVARIVFLWIGLVPHESAAQMRPLEPVLWQAYEPDAEMRAGVGIGVMDGQRASLAGTRGTLFELGNWFITYRSGRFALEFAGTAVRMFEDDDVLSPPFERTDPPDGDARIDAGDVRIATILRLAG